MKSCSDDFRWRAADSHGGVQGNEFSTSCTLGSFLKLRQGEKGLLQDGSTEHFLSRVGCSQRVHAL